ncbi:hypothetical protein DXT88_06025 [Herbaspirillum lusitanum]|uniref:hypothetical protein n=1 Tax=Herbaspirillum lusitanum TaxID=213312 RepID=UPI002236F860|nr:hypothetical protein [Herbaspirillum lusitanum]MCW5297730.1 hypothetical protein [Herbaspirillum lusitanum]
MDVNKNIAKLSLVIGLAAIAATSGASEIYSAKFRTIKTCLASIQKSTKQKLEIIRDKPTIVTGSLTNGETFACEVKETGSEGVYVEGWYTSK